MGTHHLEKFGASDSNSRHTAPPINVFDIGAIPPTDPDDINKSTHHFDQFSNFHPPKIVGGRPIPDEVCISKRWPSCTKCEIFRGHAP